MRWSPEQDAALKAVSEWLENDESQVFRLFGYAGTGKTTLARHLAADVDGQVMFGAFTGKAAHVLRQKGCDGASTIHSMIYHAKDKAKARLQELEAELAEVLHEYASEPDIRTMKPEERERALGEVRSIKNLREKIGQERKALAQPTFTLNPTSEVKTARLVVIDECSMIDGRMGEDLLSYGTKVLVLGDPAQLPPVKGAGFFTEGVRPDFMLTEIHRQAAESPIIHMATKVRQGERLQTGSYGDCRVTELGGIGSREALDADQILVGRNKTRHAYNRRMRELLERGDELPVAGDRLVCLRNDHDVGLLNGAIWHVVEVGGVEDDIVHMSIGSDERSVGLDVAAWSHYFLGREQSLGWWERKDAQEFDYGYALTTHKSQGSQWDDVLVFDESFCFRENRDRWLYTAITRAAERLTVVKM